MDAEVIIVGAGPAGSSAAYHLARAGRRVRLLERHRFPRDKSCGDGLTRVAVRALGEMGVLPELEQAQRTCGVRAAMRGRGSRVFKYPSGSADPSGGLVVPRRILDEILCRKAVAAGAELSEETLAVSLVREDKIVTGVEIICRGERALLHAPIVVLADGASSRLATDAGLAGTPLNRLGVAVRGYFTDIEGLSPLLEIYTPLLDPTDRYLLPSYGWVFPTGPTTANIGVGLFERERGANVGELFQSFLDALARDDPRFAHLRPCSQWKGAPLRFDFAPERCTAQGVVLVGDAAGLISPFTGEGIGYALESGKLAAETIHRKLEPGQTRAPDLSEYAAILAQRYTGYFETGRESARRYRLLWHIIESTFNSEQPLFVLCRQVALFPEGLGDSFTDAALDDVSAFVEHAEMPIRADLVSVGELLINTVRRDWPFLARALTVGQSDPGIPFRPALLLLLASYSTAGTRADGANPAAYRAAAAIELGFLASLAHFSVDDDGRATEAQDDEAQPANWGNKSALLVGDFLLAKVHDLAASVGSRISEMVAKTLADTCEGRVAELRDAYNLHRTEAQHLEMVELKTSGFFELPCRIGAMLGGLSPSHTAAFAHYGRCLGLAHELTDEAMLADGRPGKLARVTGARLRDGICGLPLLLAMRKSDEIARQVRVLLAPTPQMSPEFHDSIARVSRLVRDSGAIADALSRARSFADEANEALSALPDDPVRRSFQRLARYAVERSESLNRSEAVVRSP